MYTPCNLFCFVIQPRYKLSAVIDNYTKDRLFLFQDLNGGVFSLLNDRLHFECGRTMRNIIQGLFKVKIYCVAGNLFGVFAQIILLLSLCHSLHTLHLNVF